MEVAKRSSDIRKKENRPKTTILGGGDNAFEHARLADQVQRLLKENEQRNAELAIISSVQQGLASKLDFQSIIDLVGDQVHAITNAKSIAIALYDKTSGIFSWPYWLTFGKRVDLPNRLMEKSITRRVIYAKKPLNLGTEQEILANDAIPPQDGWTVGKSYLGVPFTVGSVMLGALSLHDFDNEHAFNESDERLLQTLANSMSIALENARLFDETEQRAAELAIINSVQSALVAKLDIQGIYDAVGNSLREIFDQSDVGIAIYDSKNNLIHIPYTYEGGKRVMVDSFVLDEQGFIAHVLRTQETLIINENMAQEMEKYGSHVIDGTVMDKSLVYVPLLVGDQARGVISLKDSQHEHAFNDSDIRLLITIANSMSIALENARLFDETQRLLKETGQRNAELAIINSVQEGLASKLEFQSIIDLVGDQVHAITNAKSISIALYDKTSGMMSWPYWLTLGKRIEISDRPMEKGITRRVMYADKPLNLGTEEEILAHDAIPPQNGWTVGKSFLGVPFPVGNAMLGALSLHDFEGEHAFNESDERLLQTLANSMSVALENARLFDETQRLLKETGQRNAELQIINSVQEGLSSKLDIQAIYDLVGDKIREIFHNADAEIRILDPKANLIRFPYFTDMGKRIAMDPIPLTDVGMSSYILRTGKTLVINENLLQEMEKYGAKMLPGGHPAKSAIFVPLVVNHRARGVLVLGDVEREHAFSESDVRLLQTLASSMSTALENARLFDETQHLLSETEQRAAELAIINSVQEGLASKLDVQAIYDLVGDKIRDIFHAQGTAIYLFDHQTALLATPYCYLKKRFEIEARPFSEHPIATLMFNRLQPITYRTVEEYRLLGGAVLENSEEYKSGMYVPLMVGKELKGMVGIANLDKENAYNDSDLRLLQTLANSMSVALENARLFDEVQKKN